MTFNFLNFVFLKVKIFILVSRQHLLVGEKKSILLVKDKKMVIMNLKILELENRIKTLEVSDVKFINFIKRNKN